MYKVSESGAATYAIPILAPPGVAGVQPSLSLVYNSQAGEGYLGKGWSLAGLSAITRCPQIVAVDGKTTGIRLNQDDRFCLDGQRLLTVSGVYGASGTEYRTEIESFSKVISYGTVGNGPASFTVWTKAGQILEFGNTTDARIEAEGKPTVLVWALNKVSDRSGNYMTIAYSETNNTGTYLPLRMDYTGNGAVAPTSSVEFSFIIRHKGMQTKFVAGSRISNHYVLDKVRAKNGATTVKEYQLAYGNDPNTDAWRLSSVTECTMLTGVLDCLLPTTFAWQDGSNYGFGSRVSIDFICENGSNAYGTCNDADNYSTIRYPDINGDGKADVCFRSDSGVQCFLGTGSGWGTYVTSTICANGSSAYGICNDGDNHYSIQFADFNGDGSADIVFRSDSGIRVYRYNGGTGFSSLFTSTLCANASTVIASLSTCSQNTFASISYPDLNGDGKADICWRSNRGISCLLGTGSGFGSEIQTGICGKDSSTFGGCNDDDNYLTIRFADLNGDGKQDLVFRSDAGIRAFTLNDANTWMAALYSETLCGNSDTDCPPTTPKEICPSGQYCSALTAKNYEYISYADVNGDGLADICYRSPFGIRCRMSTGVGFNGNAIYTGICANESALWGGCDWTDNYSSIRFFDLNGDGKSDLVYRANQGITTSLSTGAAFVNPQTTPVCADGSSAYGGCNDSDNYSTITFADFNGDGMADLAYRSDIGIRTGNWVGKPPNQITSITNGLGMVTTIAYRPATDALVYMKGASVVYPASNIQPAVSVVEYHDTSDGIGGLYRLSYKYAGARVNRAGRGFLGFQTVTAKDEETGIETVNTYLQDFPYIGRPSLTVKRYTTATGYWELARSTNTYSMLNLGGGRYFPYGTSSNDKTYELDTALLASPLVSDVTTNSVYDAYGNPTLITTSTPDGYKKVTASTYSNDTVNWLLGKLTRSEVTSTLPDLTSQKRTSAFAYNGLGLLTREVVEPDQMALSLTKSYFYDVFGNRTMTIVAGVDIAQRSSSVSYDAQGRFPIQATNEMGHLEKYEYDPNFGVVSSLTGPNNRTTYWSYDVFGRKTSEYRADGTTTTWTLSDCDATCPPLARTLIQSVDTGSPPKKAYSDILGREIRSAVLGFSGQWIYKDTEYDSMGRILRTSRPYFVGSTTLVWSSLVYDRMNRVVQQINPDNTITTTAYKGLTTVVTNARNASTTQFKNSQGQVIKVTDALNNSTSYTYDHFGNLIKTLDAKSNTITAVYDLRGRKIEMTDPDMGRWYYVYDVSGNLIKQIDAKGQLTTFEYDKLGRMTKRIEPGLTSFWTYDTSSFGIGKLSATSTSTSTGMSKVLSYDYLGRLKSTTANYGTTGVNYVTQTNYDSLGRQDSTIYPGGFTVNNIYNEIGYLAEVRDATFSQRYWRALSQNSDGQITQENLGNGLLSVYSFDLNTGRLKSMATQLPSTFASPAVQTLAYAYDAVGNVTQVQDADGITESFTYDTLNRLTGVASSVANKTYVYDSIGNITSKSDVGTYAYGVKPHAVTSTSGTLSGNYYYDANGNMLTGNGRTVAYNAFNKPTSITLGSAASSYTYDENHDRIRKVTASATTTYAGKLYEETRFSNGSVEKRHYIHAGGRLIAIFVDRGTSTQIQYTHLNHLGSIHVLTDGSGAIIARYSYDAFGKRRNTNGTDLAAWPATTPGTRGYTGHEMDDDTRCINMNAREYDPVLGRFLQADSIVARPGSTQGLNRYSYTDNNPMSRVDMSGNDWLSDPWKQFWNNGGQELTAVAIGVYMPGIMTGYGYTAGTAALATGAAAGYALTGTVDGAVKGAMTAGIFYGVGSAFETPGLAKTLAHGAAGGVTSVMQGGEFRSGMMSAGFAEMVGGSAAVSDMGGVQQGIARVLIGGTASVIAGGEFRDGARTAAFAYLFNKCSHEGCWVTAEERKLAEAGKWFEYYQTSCGNGDSYACSALSVATADGVLATATNYRLAYYLLKGGTSILDLPSSMSSIRANLAQGYVEYLDKGLRATESSPQFPTRPGITEVHDKTFQRNGAAPGAFGGSLSDKYIPRGIYDYCSICK